MRHASGLCHAGVQCRLVPGLRKNAMVIWSGTLPASWQAGVLFDWPLGQSLNRQRSGGGCAVALPSVMENLPGGRW